MRDKLPEQETKDQMILGILFTSHDKPKVGILCTDFDRVVLPRTPLAKTVHKTPTLGLSCEVNNIPRHIWSFVSCSGSLYLKLLLLPN